MCIYPLSDLTYRLTMGAFRSAQADRCLAIEGCKISGCFTDEGIPLGFAIYRLAEQKNKKIAFLFDLECAENSDARNTLLSSLVNQCKEKGTEEIRWSTSISDVPAGFTCENITKVYRVVREERPQWREFRKTLEPLCRREMSRGYSALSLGDCTEAQIGEIKNGYRDFRDSGYMDGVFQGKQGKLLTEYSQAIVKDGHVVAYCLVTEEPENPGDCRLCYLGTTKSTRRTPVGIFALCTSMDALDLSPYENMRFIVQEKNADSKGLMNKQLSFIRPKTVIYDYVCFFHQ